MTEKDLAAKVKLWVLIAAVFCSAVLGYMAGVRQTSPDAGASKKTYVLNLGPVHLNLTVGAMGVLVSSFSLSCWVRPLFLRWLRATGDGRRKRLTGNL